MPYTVEDFKRDYAKEYIDHYLRILPPEVVLSKYSPEERIKDLSPEERIKDLSAKELLDSLVNKPDLPPEIRQFLFEQLKSEIN